MLSYGLPLLSQQHLCVCVFEAIVKVRGFHFQRAPPAKRCDWKKTRRPVEKNRRDGRQRACFEAYVILS